MPATPEARKGRHSHALHERSPGRRMKPRDVLLALVVMLVWALNFPISKLGFALVVGEPRFGSDPLPVAMILGAAFAWAVANIQFKQIGPIDGFALTGWMAFFACPQLFVLSLILEDHHLAAITHAGWHGWGALAHGAIVITLLSYGLWYPLMREYTVHPVI